MLNRERPAFVIVHPDQSVTASTRTRGRPLREALALLAAAPLPDPEFAEDMEAVLRNVGTTSEDPWERS